MKSLQDNASIYYFGKKEVPGSLGSVSRPDGLEILSLTHIGVGSNMDIAWIDCFKDF